MRLDKFLSEVGLGTRSEVKQLLKRKVITVNDELETAGKRHVDEVHDQVALNGKVLVYEKFVYYMLNKPAGVISATTDMKDKTVLDLLDDKARQKQVFPVGRLDKDTQGLLLLTNDGQLAHQLLSPHKRVAKKYRARVNGVMTEDDREKIAQGIVLENGEVCLPGELTIETSDLVKQMCEIVLVIYEGKYHQVKRMVAACGKHVYSLKREAMGSLQLDEQLATGAFRTLTEQEICQLHAIHS